MRHPAVILGKIVDRLRRRFLPASLILMYHRVADVGMDPWGLCVTPVQFREHLELLHARRVRLLAMRDLVKALEIGRVPPRSVAITFDDGYADNFLHAHPLLTHYGAPATVFVTAGQIGAVGEFWWDILERIFLNSGKLPAVLDLVVNGQPRRWELGQSRSFGLADAERWRHWRTHEPPPTARHRIHNEVWQVLFEASRGERERLTAELAFWAGLPPGARPTHRTMTEAELRHLTAEGVVEVGAHTWSHSSLSALSIQHQADELRRGKAHLEAVLGRPVTGCSYPHGRCSPDTIHLVRELGYAYACGSTQGSLRSDADPFHLPRVVVENWGTQAFEGFLTRHLPI